MRTTDMSKTRSRLGFHYFPDTLHYREVDLHAWLPEIHEMGGSWLTLIAPKDRAIPEDFITTLIRENIEPVLHFHLSPSHPPDLKNLHLLLNLYASWGVEYVSLFDRPNSRRSWQANTWTQSDLVERFLDVFLPAAALVMQSNLTPVFPPLEPGGDYWDLAFLRAALQGILRRGYQHLADNLVLGAYAWADDKPLGWGAGGPERFPQARPYHTPAGQEDQRGFYIFDWYQAVAQAELCHPLPIILIGAGFNPTGVNAQKAEPPDIDRHTRINLNIARLMAGKPVLDIEPLPPVPSQVLACNYWLLAALPKTPEAHLAWFKPDGSALPIVRLLKQFNEDPDGHFLSDNSKKAPTAGATSTYPIPHYLLLSAKDIDQDNQLLTVLSAYIREHHPTIGFSIAEACLAERVTILDSQDTISVDELRQLRGVGCQIERLNRDGISIATNNSTLETDRIRGEK